MVTLFWSFAVGMACGENYEECTFLCILHFLFIRGWQMELLTFYIFICLSFSSSELFYRFYCSISSCTCDIFIFSSVSYRLIINTLCILSCDLQRWLWCLRKKNLGECIHPHFNGIESLLRIFTSVYKML